MLRRTPIKARAVLVQGTTKDEDLEKYIIQGWQEYSGSLGYRPYK